VTSPKISERQVQWLRRKMMFPNRSWGIFIETDLHKIGGYKTLIGGMHKKTKLDKLLGYNQEIFKAWTELSQNPSPDNGNDLKKISLWNNRDITDAKGNPMYVLNLEKAFISTVGNLFDKNNQPINNLAKNNINPNLFLEWMSIRTAIPQTWIQSIKETPLTDESPDQGSIINKDIGVFTKDEYIILDKLTQKTTLNIIRNRKKITRSKFNAEMSEKLDMKENDWSFLYKKINKWSISTKHRSFSWRIYNGIVFTNKDFARFGFKESAKCSFCQETSQNREHLLLKCPSILKFRHDVCAKFDTFQNKVITDKLLLFGCFDSGMIKDASSEACDILISM
jgi:hypothetical protein